MASHRRISSILIIILLVCSVSTAPALDQKAGPALERELQDILETFLRENNLAPGVLACVICPRANLDWTGAAGDVARDDPTPLTPANTFRIASNTKTYVAAAILRLVELGRMGLDDSLAGYLPPDQNRLLAGDGYDTDAITIAQVLSHTAGLGDHSNDSRFEERIMADPQYSWTAEEKIRLLVEWRDPVGEPGEKYIYSDTGYIILGTIIERVTGGKLGPAVRDLIDYEKLGLDVTYWEYMENTPDEAGARAHQYYGEKDVTSWYASFDLYGGGGIVTDARELALFMRLLLKGNVFENESTLTAMTTRGALPYRLGLMVKECDGRVVLGHQGFWNTFAFHVPSEDLTVAGSVQNHDAANGAELMCRLVSAVLTATEERND